MKNYMVKIILETLKPILIGLLVMAISMSMGYKLAEWYHKENYKELIKYELKKERERSTSTTFF
jgi:hypothetical protein